MLKWTQDVSAGSQDTEKSLWPLTSRPIKWKHMHLPFMPGGMFVRFNRGDKEKWKHNVAKADNIQSQRAWLAAFTMWSLGPYVSILRRFRISLSLGFLVSKWACLLFSFTRRWKSVENTDLTIISMPLLNVSSRACSGPLPPLHCLSTALQCYLLCHGPPMCQALLCSF